MSLRGKRAGFVAAEIALALLQVTRLPPALSAALWGIAILLALYWVYIEAERVWFGQGVREADGFGAYFAVFIETGNLERRQYLYDFRNSDTAGVAMYLSAAGKPTFLVTDTMGEAYPLEAPTGTDGLPFGHWIYVATEVRLWPTRTYLRWRVNGRTIAERVVPFRMALGGNDWKPHPRGMFGNDAKFRLQGFIWRTPTLGPLNNWRMVKYAQRKWQTYD